jgi:hypothetical protein
MSDYHATATSNTFRVRNRAAFERALNGLPIRVETAIGSRDRCNVYLACEADHGTWPSERDDPARREGVAVDLLALIGKHLRADQVAILKEAGAEKLAYIGGVAHAVNAAGETAHVDLDEIFARAAHLGTALSSDV